ncbi:S-methyl-5-thioribose-1-phosphate isomerase [Dethiobacter alkaliphilus]|uniref:Methylthioribose-1-phosphate isomerase n=1 Tax=Dethiobacter alkaliphilus AHT 1 TaxID=555088 RepID=C0GHU7_DETAL|nr:S-methyl-5-thioribose-1-phosphate isomerase [Dethiobacter alkaliphilus]EEG77021.1 translation initiation factor, aIF-2BI family [Dethiobacter alkaliphilus AHT 1]
MDPIRFEYGVVFLLDQRLLPVEVKYMECKSWQEVAAGIRDMVVRGAPAIGASAAFGMALAAKQWSSVDSERFFAGLEEAAKGLKATRPTAVNLAWAVERMLNVARTQRGVAPREIADILDAEARRIAQEDIAVNKKIGDFGAGLINDKARILTHCNAGALATVGYGTALGVIRRAVAHGKEVHVFADETRPYLQGARLTAWELHRDEIPVTVIADNMAGFLMKQGKIDVVIVGADRIAANGDVANKIGTYSVAVLAAAHNIPFYVAAPYSTFDLAIKSGEQIPIEERCETEITHFAGRRIAPEGIGCYNPSFDVTPANLITAIITEFGVIEKPDEERVRQFFAEAGHEA